MAADTRISLEIAAIDAFSKVFQTAQDDLVHLQQQARAAFNTTPSAIQNELADLQNQFNKASQKMAKSSSESTGQMKTGIVQATESGKGLNGVLDSMAGYVIAAFSVTAIVSFIKEAFNAQLQMDAINSKLKVLTGSQKAASEEWNFVRQEAKRLGLDLQQTADSYSSFAVATKNTSMEGEAARKMFVSVAEAATALHLPADMTTRVLYQFQQMLSKGKVNMEDLKTASESFPGLLKQVADALGITTSQLMDQMQKGELMAADMLPKLGEQLHKTYGTAATEAAEQGRSALNRFSSSVFELKVAFGSETGDSATAFLKFITRVVETLQESIRWVQQAKIFWSALFDKAAAWNRAGGLPGLIIGGSEARAELQAEFDAIDQMAQAQWNKTLETGRQGAQKQAGEETRNSQRRRDEAKKNGEELAKINLEYLKAIGATELELTAQAEQEYQKRITAAKAYYDQKKAAAKSNSEETEWEKAKTAKLAEIARQHSQEYLVIQAQMVDAAVTKSKAGLDIQIANIKQQAAEHVITEEDAARKITALSLAAANEQYQAKLYVAEKAAQVYGRDSDEYKKALAAQQSSHAAFIAARTEAYKKYSDQIKALEKSIADYRTSMQNRIKDLQQRGMTDEQKYADNLKRYNEAIDQAESMRRQKKYDEAEKYNKQAEEMASRLADTQAKGVNGVEAATKALQRVEENGVRIMEDKKEAAEENLKKLKELADQKLDPKKLEINLEESALNRVKEEIANLTKSEKKSIYIETIGPSTDSRYTNYQGMATGGPVGGSGTGDNQLRLLDPREWVIRPEATAFWGSRFMSMINNPWSAGRDLMDRISGFNLPAINLPSPSLGMATGGPVGNMMDLGTLNITVGGSSFPVMGQVDVLSELKTALRRETLKRGQ